MIVLKPIVEVLGWVFISFLAWIIIGLVISYYNWDNAFNDENALTTLRLFTLLGFGVGTFRTFLIIKHKNF